MCLSYYNCLNKNPFDIEKNYLEIVNNVETKEPHLWFYACFLKCDKIDKNNGHAGIKILCKLNLIFLNLILRKIF